MRTMDDLITNYLFQNKSCPLPGVGVLLISNGNAKYVVSEKEVHPPMPAILFSSAEQPADEFIEYIAGKSNIGREEAIARVEIYCSKLHNLDAYSEMEIPFAGKFYVDGDGNLVFKQNPYPSEFLPAVQAERIIHPEATHAILVGDKESNSALMTEFYTDAESTVKDRWWIWAIVFALIAATGMIVYFNNFTGTGTFGNSKNIPATDAPKTYEQVD